MNLRIGCVPYLNAKPLIYGIEDQITFATPSQLADQMRDQQLDVALVPIAEVIACDQYDIIDEICIGARGPVQSVFLAHRTPLEKLKQIAVDPASRTSTWLLRILLKLGYNVIPEFYPRPPGAKLSDHEAMMLIGDEAIWYATRTGAQSILDLGIAWVQMTALPFVFAAWAVHKGKGSPEISTLLHTAKSSGLAHIDEIVDASSEATSEFRRTYLTRSVSYNLGEKEKRGIHRFQQYAKEVGLIGKYYDLRYIS